MPHDLAGDLVERLDIRALAIARKSSDPKAWRIGSIRPMIKEDLAILVSSLTSPDPRAPLARISAPHHMLAKLLAEGKTAVEVSSITGYTPARIQTLKVDPAFSELIAHYETESIQTSADIHAQVTHVALTAKQLLMERLEDEPETFSNKDLMTLFNAGLDRIGHGPGSKLDVNLNDPARILESLRETITSVSSGQVIPRARTIDVEVTEVILDNDPAPSDQ